MKKILLIISFYICWTSIVWSQDFVDITNRRGIIVEQEDTTIRASILNTVIDIDTDYTLYYYWYYREKINFNQGGFEGNLLDGRYTVYNANKQLLTEGEFSLGLKHSTWKKWDSTGRLLWIKNYKKGKLHGEFLIFNKNGELIERSVYKNNELSKENSSNEESLDNEEVTVEPDSAKIKKERNLIKKRRKEDSGSPNSN